MGHYPGDARYRLNNATMWVIAALIFVTPFFLGGNRPAVWALTAGLIFFWAAWYGLRLLMSSRRPRIQPADLRLIGLLFALLALYQLFQMLPLGLHMPQQWLALPYGVDPGWGVSLSPQDTALAMMRWGSYGVLFFLTVQFSANTRRAILFLNVLFWIVVAHAAYGAILLFEFGDTILLAKKWAYQGSATGGFVNRNSFATFLAIGFTVGTSLLVGKLVEATNSSVRNLSVRDVVLFLCGMVVILVTLVATGSRMGVFVGLTGAFMALVLGLCRKGIRIAPVAILTLLLGIGITIKAIFFLYGEILAERLISVEEDRNVRADLYDQIWTMILNRPLLGFGGDGFEHAYPLFHHAPVSADVRWDKAHSTYLALWSEYGFVFGSIPLLIVAICAVVLAAHFLRYKAVAPLTVSALAVIVVGALHSLVDFSLEIEGVAFLFIVVIAAGMGGAIAGGKRKHHLKTEAAV